jgi:formylglycine-generating enzyme required for sulfatase activity
MVLSDFAIDTCPVTNAEFLRYVEATGAKPPASWTRGRYPYEKADHPVTGVSWYAAMAYAQWKGRRLPTVAEWEKAARGADGRTFPWGDTFDVLRCNTQESGVRGTTPVRRYPDGASPYGVLDLAGNAAEWMADEVAARGLGSPPKRALKGGSWKEPRSLAECATQSSARPEEQLDFVGFRCVCDV